MDSESESIRNHTDSDQGKSEDLFGSNYLDDYKSLPELDTYDISDASTEKPMTYSEICRMEREVNEKMMEEESDKLNDATLDVDHSLVSLFKKFLLTFENKKYVQAIKKLCMENEESLYVDYLDLETFSDAIIKSLLCKPEETLFFLDKGLELAVKEFFPNYSKIKQKVHTRILNLPVLENIRELRNLHLNTLIKVGGIVTRVSNILPQINIVKFICTRCNGTFGPYVVDKPDFKPANCFECNSRGPFLINSQETLYKDYQKITIQEVPGSVLPGNLPRNKEVICFFDLIDKTKPGDEVEIVGIYKNNFCFSLNNKNGFPVFSTVIEANSILNKQNEFSTLKINEDDIKLIEKYSKKENIKEIIFNSLAPSIFGHMDIKKAIALSLFSGVRKIYKDKIVRGDINVLMLGDPGTAKSQFLRYIQGIMHRSVLTTGKGASSVGLTASVQKDPVTKEWTLEGGALVLADGGICMIDEFDKMNENDRVSIHEAMEQQTVSISKAGIITSLNARCGIIAAANPLRGQYNQSINFHQNVNLSDPIISRFDILCVVKDIIDVDLDSKMGKFVLENHSNTIIEFQEKKRKQEEKEIMDQDLLKKYIVYARNNIKPVIKEIDLEKISQFYTEIRKESLTSCGIPITVRNIESIIRMSEAFAKMRLSNVVTQQDIDDAIYVALNSFINAQKFSVTKQLRKKFSKYLIKNQEDEILFFVLNDIFNERMKCTGISNVSVDKNDFEKVARGQGFKISKMFYQSKKFLNGYLIEGGKIKRI